MDAGSQALSAFIKFHPFMAFFCFLADLQYHPAQHHAEARVATLRSNSPWLYWICVGLDFILTLVAVTAVVCIAGAIAYKSLIGEIPNPFDPSVGSTPPVQ